MKDDKDPFRKKITRKTIDCIINDAINPILENTEIKVSKRFSIAMSSLSNSIAIVFKHMTEQPNFNVQDKDIDNFLKIINESIKEGIKDNTNENRN
jgi:hypothetical protein